VSKLIKDRDTTIREDVLIAYLHKQHDNNKRMTYGDWNEVYRKLHINQIRTKPDTLCSALSSHLKEFK